MDDPRYAGKRPWSISLELTEGCNRRCTFCGIHSLYRQAEDEVSPYKFMEFKLALQLAADIYTWLGDKVRLEFALEGEPLLNPHAYNIFAMLRSRLPRCQIMVTTNADPLREGFPERMQAAFDHERLANLFGAGVNILLMDYYDNPAQYQRFFAAAVEAGPAGIPVYDFYEDGVHPWSYKGHKVQEIIVVDSIMRKAGENPSRLLNNQAGNSDPARMAALGVTPKPLPMRKRCANPTRELVIKHDGTISICCMDWQREHNTGKFPEQHLQEIWESPHMQAIRSLLYRGRRDLLTPCNRCDFQSKRAGLLTDPLGHGNDESHDRKLATAAGKARLQHRHLANQYANQPFIPLETTP